MTPAAVFEEFRFVWELSAAEFVFLLPFAQRKPHFRQKVLLGLVFFSTLSLGYFLILELGCYVPGVFFRGIVCGWYIVLALLIMAYTRLCFQLTACESLYFGVSSYAAQHIVYIVVHEMLAIKLWPELANHLILYGIISLCFSIVVLSALYLIFAKELGLCGGIFLTDTVGGIAHHIALLCILIICTFSCQSLFHQSEEVQTLAAQLGLLICVLTLGLQYRTLSAIRANQERVVIERMLQNSGKNYNLAKEMVDHINRTCHDLKHNLEVLKTIDQTQRQAYIMEAERSIGLYHELVHCENEVLNTILAEKCLFCKSRDIDLSCAIDGVNLEFVSIPDLYAILGNAIDNAIECVIDFDDLDKRVIDLTISQSDGFCCIQTNNYCQRKPEMLDGLPLTTKSDQRNHGFGLRSIRYLAKKYGGDMVVSVSGHIFTLQIMIPASM